MLINIEHLKIAGRRRRMDDYTLLEIVKWQKRLGRIKDSINSLSYEVNILSDQEEDLSKVHKQTGLSLAYLQFSAKNLGRVIRELTEFDINLKLLQIELLKKIINDKEKDLNHESR